METHLETADGDFKSRETLSILSDTNNRDEPLSQKHRQIENTSQEERSGLGQDDRAGVENSLGMYTFVFTLQRHTFTGSIGFFRRYYIHIWFILFRSNDNELRHFR